MSCISLNLNLEYKFQPYFRGFKSKYFPSVISVYRNPIIFTEKNIRMINNKKVVVVGLGAKHGFTLT